MNHCIGYGNVEVTPRIADLVQNQFFCYSVHHYLAAARILNMTNFKNTALGLITACFFGGTLPVHAHDFWLAPESYQAQEGQALDISIMIGHPADRMLWPVDPHRVISFRSFGPDGLRDQQAAISNYNLDKELLVTFESSGIHMLTIETTQAFSKLESEKFNAYLEEEGLTPIIIDRVRKGATENAGTEVYSRRGKSIIQVGSLNEDDSEFLTRPVGMTLEVVPLTNPARLVSGEAMKSQIFYRGKPQAGVTIGLIDLSGDLGLTQKQISDENGYVSFLKPSSGAWMQHAVWSDPMENTERADYDTIFSSLSFSIP